MLTIKRYAELMDCWGKSYDDEHVKLFGSPPAEPHWMIAAGEVLLSQAARVIELEAQLADAKKDAERYQWLRKNINWVLNKDGERLDICANPTAWDDIIDSDMADSILKAREL